ncbi:MAG TPA: hypothetical protein VMS93_10425 [Candidatus Saccharimonadales bacterium]|nr:hypothetical protein [Candidatus Saccharimonadales bacterium]
MNPWPALDVGTTGPLTIAFHLAFADLAFVGRIVRIDTLGNPEAQHDTTTEPWHAVRFTVARERVLVGLVPEQTLEIERSWPRRDARPGSRVLLWALRDRYPEEPWRYFGNFLVIGNSGELSCPDYPHSDILAPIERPAGAFAMELQDLARYGNQTCVAQLKDASAVGLARIQGKSKLRGEDIITLRCAPLRWLISKRVRMPRFVRCPTRGTWVVGQGDSILVPLSRSDLGDTLVLRGIIRPLSVKYGICRCLGAPVARLPELIDSLRQYGYRPGPRQRRTH